MPSRKTLWLVAILAVEGLLFLWHRDHFFNGDSLFFFSHRLEGLTDVLRVFQGPDHLWQYRPLTFVIFTFILNPLFGLNPIGYNLFPIAVHALNTILVFGILRGLGLTERAALLGTFFFGAHCVAFYVTYGVAFLPDLSYSFFYLLSVYLFVRFLHAGLWRALAASLLSFILALFCKEATITLPVVVVAISLLWGKGGFHTTRGSMRDAVSLTLRRTSPYLLLGAVYMGFHWITKAGQIYAPGVSHPHHSEFSLYTLHYKYKYLKWAFNLPDGLVFRFEGWLNYLIALALLIFIVPFLLTVVRHLWMRDRLTWCGCTWFLAALSPVLLLRNLTMHHNLYVPLVGLALVMGIWLDGLAERFVIAGRRPARRAVPVFVAVSIAAVFFHNQVALKDSWIAVASSVAETSLQDLKELRPTLPDGASLYIIDGSPVPRGELQWFYDYGSLFRLFYSEDSLDVQFIGRDAQLPDRHDLPAKAIILRFDGDHLSEISGSP